MGMMMRCMMAVSVSALMLMYQLELLIVKMDLTKANELFDQLEGGGGRKGRESHRVNPWELMQHDHSKKGSGSGDGERSGLHVPEWIASLMKNVYGLHGLSTTAQRLSDDDDDVIEQTWADDEEDEGENEGETADEILKAVAAGEAVANALTNEGAEREGRGGMRKKRGHGAEDIVGKKAAKKAGDTKIGKAVEYDKFFGLKKDSETYLGAAEKVKAKGIAEVAHSEKRPTKTLDRNVSKADTKPDSAGASKKTEDKKSLSDAESGQVGEASTEGNAKASIWENAKNVVEQSEKKNREESKRRNRENEITKVNDNSSAATKIRDSNRENANDDQKDKRTYLEITKRIRELIHEKNDRTSVGKPTSTVERVIQRLEKKRDVMSPGNTPKVLLAMLDELITEKRERKAANLPRDEVGDEIERMRTALRRLKRRGGSGKSFA